MDEDTCEGCVNFIRDKGGDWLESLTPIQPATIMWDIVMKIIGLGEEVYFEYDPVTGLEPTITFYKKINNKFVVSKFIMTDYIEMLCSLPSQSTLLSLFIPQPTSEEE